MTDNLTKSSFPLGPDVPAGRPLLVGLISDTHGVLCPEVLQRLRGVDLILHAGDVGHHGGATEILKQLAEVAPVYAVRGNVDDKSDSGGDVGREEDRDDEGDGDVGGAARPPGGDVGAHTAAADTAAARGVGIVGVGCGSCTLPDHLLLEVAGWRILVTHIVGQPPRQVDPAALDLIRRHQPHIVIFGHSHKHTAVAVGGRRYYNPGSAGPARFKLPRTAALLKLPRRRASDGGVTADGAEEPEPVFTLMTLQPKAPPRLTIAKQPLQRLNCTSGATAAAGSAAVDCPCAADAVQPATGVGPQRPTGNGGDGGGGCTIGGHASPRRSQVRGRIAGSSAGAGCGSEEPGSGEGGHTSGRRGREGGVAASACGSPARRAPTGKRRKANGAS